MSTELRKRNVLSPDRYKDLKNSVYIVRCNVDDCPSHKDDKECLRGFFSLFIQAVNGISFANRHGIACIIDYGNYKYLYSDPNKFDKDKNFWNYYFYQPHVKGILENGQKYTINTMYETYPLRIWSLHFLKKAHLIVKEKIRFKPKVDRILSNKKHLFQEYRILGLQMRGTDHHNEVQPVKFSKYLRVLTRNKDKYDKFFIATDDFHVLKSLIKMFGEEKILYNSVKRSENNDPVHTNMDNKDRYELGLEVLTDCYCLSLCNKAILVHSNISYAALLFNPDLNYTLFETFTSKLNRYKTLLLYYLDYLGIRSL